MINVSNFAWIFRHVNHIFAPYYVASSTACLVFLCYSSLSHKRHEFSTRKYTLLKYILIFAAIPPQKKTFLNPRRILRDIVINLHIFYVMCMLILLLFTDFKVSYAYFLKSQYKFYNFLFSGGQFFLCDKTDMKLIVYFRSMANVPKKNGRELLGLSKNV